MSQLVKLVALKTVCQKLEIFLGLVCAWVLNFDKEWAKFVILTRFGDSLLFGRVFKGQGDFLKPLASC